MKTIFQLKFLVWVLGASLLGLTLVHSASAAGTQKILFLGDSLTEGYGLDRDLAYPALIEKILHAEGKKEIKVINAGESGSKSSSGKDRLKWQLKGNPTILVLALGANDGLRGVDPQQVQANLEQVIALALEQKMKVLLVGMKMPFNYGASYMKKFEGAYTELVKKYQGKVQWLPYLLEGVGGQKELNLPDGIHPNEKGHQIMAKNVLKSLRVFL